MKQYNNRLKRLEKQLRHNTNQIIDITKQAEAIRKHLYEGVAYEDAGFQEVKLKRTPEQEEYSEYILNKYLN